MTDYFIHIGLPRTATTYLQTQFFPRLKEVKFYGIPFTHFSSHFQQMLFQDDSMYDPGALKKTIEGFRGEKILLSNENFVGQSLYFNHSNRTRNAMRLKEVMPNAKIIVFLRNQLDLLQSLYSISVYANESRKEEQFIKFPSAYSKLDDWQQDKLYDWSEAAYYNTFTPSEHLDNYLFNPLVELYKGLFEHVEIFLYEDLVQNSKQVFRRLEELFQSKLEPELESAQSHVNSSLSKKQIQWTRLLNRFYPAASSNKLSERIFHKSKRSVINWTASKEKFNFSSNLQDRIRAFYKEDNQQLNKKYPEIGLERYPKMYSLNTANAAAQT